jgi:site-specific DNA-methyltransferase (adenine-specific)
VRVAYDHDRATILVGDASRIGEMLPENSVDALVTDPPAGIDFMNKGWDSDKGGRDAWTAWLTAAIAASFRALKPGGHGLVWAIPRTSHWTARALEDAGFEVRDIIMHVFGSGFPKNLDVSKVVDALDARQERRRRALVFTAWVRASGLTAQRINELTGTNMGSHYVTDKEQPTVATAELFALLRPHLPAVPPEIEELVRERTVESENLRAREVVGTQVVPGRPGFAGEVLDGDTDQRGGTKREVAVTAPLTPEAQKWAGWGTALKPAAEHWILVRKPLGKLTVAECVMKYGTGGMNIAASWIGENPGYKYDASRNGTTFHGEQCARIEQTAEKRGSDTIESEHGRWPAHFVLSHDDACTFEACAHDCPVALIDAQAGGAVGSKGAVTDDEPSPAADGTVMNPRKRMASAKRKKKDGPSQFFYVAKAPRSEKDAGLDHLPMKTGGEATDREDGSAGLKNPRAGAGRTGGARNFHPTVKSVTLMRWLIRLVTPPGGIVLDPFAGSGTTGVAALAEGCRFVGCEQGGKDEEYVPVLVGRIAHALTE